MRKKVAGVCPTTKVLLWSYRSMARRNCVDCAEIGVG